MEIYLIRHTTPAVAIGMIYGRTDVALADTFVEEREKILKKLPSELDVVYSSPSTRCTQLADHISKNYRTDERLYEVNFGRWEGKTWDTVDQQESAPWMQDFVHVCPPEGESMLAMQKRVMHFWEGLLRLSPAKAAVVTHGGVIRIILAAVRNMALQSSFEIKVGLSDVILVRPHLSGRKEEITVL
ncbi:alpha-ribazole phosphatase [Pontibacter diazotrophicus]|uniref:Alpha-ribazole phosphatase n=1 Tax=Pontibacter diazotrophicus TaxID=1400979 RepID=A0A3D8L1V9_9BACT|nr:alpha-ribazole phosphatase [Pontibacter diazotrophicus]RDV11355.1 alpha-ribazole phosphatase [Pontibacter diazotrophicus]